MGGAGSGTWYRWEKRTTLDEVKRLDVRWLYRHGYLDGRPRWVPWHRGEHQTGSVSVALVDSRLVIEYRARRRGTATWEDIREGIPLDWTPCHYGAQRPWLRCPGCQRRVAVLCADDTLLLCRHCYRLPYASQGETGLDRGYRKARKIRTRLGTSHHLTEPVWPWHKPKGMHWRTWERLRAQEEHAHRLVLAELEEALARLRRGA